MYGGLVSFTVMRLDPEVGKTSNVKPRFRLHLAPPRNEAGDFYENPRDTEILKGGFHHQSFPEELIGHSSRLRFPRKSQNTENLRGGFLSFKLKAGPRGSGGSLREISAQRKFSIEDFETGKSHVRISPVQSFTQ